MKIVFFQTSGFWVRMFIASEMFLLAATADKGTLGRLFKDAGIQYGADPASDEAIKTVLGDINPLWDWRRWPGGNKNLIADVYPQTQDVDRILINPAIKHTMTEIGKTDPAPKSGTAVGGVK